MSLPSVSLCISPPLSLYLSLSLSLSLSLTHRAHLKGENRRKMNFIYVLGFLVLQLRDVVKSLSGQFSFVCEKDDREESSTKSLGGMMRPKDEMGSQIVSSESEISHLILVYRSRNNNSQAQARRFPARTPPEPEFPVIFSSKWDPRRACGVREAPAPRDSLNFRRASLLSRYEFERGTIVLHATSSFTYVSVIYGANFPFKHNIGSASALPIILGNASIVGEPWTARSVFVDENEVVPYRGDVTDLWLLTKQCTVTQWRQGQVERTRDGGVGEMKVSAGFGSSHWLF